MGLRSSLFLSGALGVAGGAVLTGVALFLWRRYVVSPLVSGVGVWLLLGFLLFFSLAEIPLMIFGLRRLADSASGVRLAILTNAAFTFFAAVYAAPFLLLTGRVKIGLALASLCLFRLASALSFVPGRRPLAADPQPDLQTISGGEEE
jgi:hypothetical protein